MPPRPKPDALRQRRNKVTTAAQLPTAEESATNEVPPLPDRSPKADGTTEPWHPMVVEWWESVWRSPMASEYVGPDIKGGLYMLADLHQLRWTVRDGMALKDIASEIRLQEVRFGLSPIDRQRLRWTIEQGEGAAERTEARRERKAPPTKPVKDPRAVLKAI